MKAPSALRGLRWLVSGLVLGAGALALDARATPDVTGQEPWVIGAPRSEEAPPENGSRPDALPAGIDAPRTALDFGDVPYDFGGLERATGTPAGDDSRNMTRTASGMGMTGMTYSAVEIRPQDFIEWLLALPEAIAIRQFAAQANALVGSPGHAPPHVVVEQRETLDKGTARDYTTMFKVPRSLDEAVEMASHPFSLLFALICVLGWLIARMLNHFERVQTERPRSTPIRRRRRRRSRRWFRFG